MFYIVYVDGRYQAIVDKSGRPNRYGQKLLFKKALDAQKWIARKSYPHMTHHYLIMGGVCGMTSIKKQIHYRFNRLLYRFQWAVLKWTRGDCRHVCRFCKYYDECMLDIMLDIKGHKYIK